MADLVVQVASTEMVQRLKVESPSRRGIWILKNDWNFHVSFKRVKKTRDKD